VALQIHPVVQDAADLDDPSLRCPVQQEVASGTTAPGNVERAAEQFFAPPR
jgi:hypothetical protein